MPDYSDRDLSYTAPLNRGYDMEWIKARSEEQPDGCWLWKEGTGWMGYPFFSYEGRTGNGPKTFGWMVGRLAFAIANDGIYEDCKVKRTCGVKLCVNPAHGREIKRHKEWIDPIPFHTLDTNLEYYST